MKEEYIPKIGDVVRLLISKSNFNEHMEDIVKNTPIVIVTQVHKRFEDYKIEFDGCDQWDWDTYNNHFELVDPGEEDLSYIEPLTQLLKDIK